MSEILPYFCKYEKKFHNLKLGHLISKLNYPLPFFYKNSLNTFKPNFNVVYELLLNNQKPLILSLGLLNSIGKGKTSLISKLFSIDEENSLTSSQDGYTHNGSIDIFTPTDENDLKYYIADINGFSENLEFLKMVKHLMNFSAVIIFHLYYNDFDVTTGKPKNENRFMKMVNYVTSEHKNYCQGKIFDF